MDQLNVPLAMRLCRDLLDPEGLGHAATPEIRDRARVALGLPRVETGPRAVPAGLGGLSRPALTQLEEFARALRQDDAARQQAAARCTCDACRALRQSWQD